MFDKRTKQAALVTALGVGLYVGLMNLSIVLSFLAKLVGLIRPVIVGGILALFIHVPMSSMQRSLTDFFSKRKNKPSDKTVLILSFAGTVLCVLLVLALVLVLLVPELIISSQRLYAQIMERVQYLEGQEFNVAWVEELLAKIDVASITQKLSDAIDGLLPNVVGALSSTVDMIITACFAVIVSIYISLGKERLSRHGRKLVAAYLNPVWADRVLLFARTFIQCFANFLTGQCTEAVILGTLMFLAFSVFQLPYGSLVGVLTAVCAIIPYVGAFLSSAISVILTLFIAPELVLRCIIVYSVVQFVENQFIYPRVVGSSVGLPPLYTLIAAMVGGKLFGIMGILFFIPLMAVIVELIKTDANTRILRKEMGNGKK